MKHLHVRDAYEVNILKCSLEYKSINYNMMDFYKSNVTIIDSLFDFLTFPDGAVLLSAESSQVRIKDVTIRYSITYQSIINVENDSQLELENVLFTKNMFYYHVKFSAFYSLTSHSSAEVKKRTFSSNTGGSLYLSTYSKLSVKNCAFSTNMGDSTGVISSNGINTSLTLWCSKFYDNRVTGGDILAEATTVNILECIFFSGATSVDDYNISLKDQLYNALKSRLDGSREEYHGSIHTFAWIHQHTGFIARDSFFQGEGVVLKARTVVQAEFIKCTFTDKVVILKGSNRVNISVDSCRINGTRNEYEPVFSLTDNSRLYITNTNVTNHKIMFGAALMNISSSCMVSLEGCLYIGNTMDGHIEARNNTNISVYDSTFIGNEAFETRFGFSYITRGRIMIQNSHFINNTAGHGNVVRANESTVELVGNIIEGNSPSIIYAISSNIAITACTFSKNILVK